MLSDANESARGCWTSTDADNVKKAALNGKSWDITYYTETVSAITGFILMPYAINLNEKINNNYK